jgi:hypothetical protein
MVLDEKPHLEMETFRLAEESAQSLLSWVNMSTVIVSGHGDRVTVTIRIRFVYISNSFKFRKHDSWNYIQPRLYVNRYITSAKSDIFSFYKLSDFFRVKQLWSEMTLGII